MSREIIFWCAAAALILAAAASIVLSFLPRRKPPSAGSSEHSTAALQDQAELLLRQKEDGLLSPSEYEAEIADIERRILEEGGAAKDRPSPGRSGPPVAAALVAFTAAASIGLYSALGSAPNINIFDSEPDRTLGAAMGEAPEFDQASLKEYLSRVKNDERAWVLYARILAREGSWSDSFSAYGSALALGGRVAGDPEIWLEYCASAMSAGTPESRKEAHRAAKKAVMMNESDTRAWQLLAISSLETGKWTDARESLEFLLGKLGEQDASRENISKAAAYAAEMERRAAGAAGAGP